MMPSLARDVTERAFPGQIDFTAFYLHDGVVAGTAEAVHLFNIIFRAESEALGLTMAMSKCEVIPPAGEAFSFPADVFQGWNWKTDGCFKLLGAPFGSEAFCTSVTAK